MTTATDANETEIDRLRIAAFKSNAESDRQAYFDAVSKWFQDRHYRQPLADLQAENERLQIACDNWKESHGRVVEGFMEVCDAVGVQFDAPEAVAYAINAKIANCETTPPQAFQHQLITRPEESR